MQKLQEVLVRLDGCFAEIERCPYHMCSSIGSGVIVRRIGDGLTGDTLFEPCVDHQDLYKRWPKAYQYYE